MRIKFRLTMSDIRAAFKSRGTAGRSKSCPLAQSIRKKYDGSSVGGTSITLVENNNVIASQIPLTKKLQRVVERFDNITENDYKYPTQSKMWAAIKKAIKPMTFVLTIPKPEPVETDDLSSPIPTYTY